MCNADLALSVAMTTCSTIVSCGLTPLNMLVYSYSPLAFGESQSSQSWSPCERIQHWKVCMFRDVAQVLTANT